MTNSKQNAYMLNFFIDINSKPKVHTTSDLLSTYLHIKFRVHGTVNHKLAMR